MKTHCVFSVAFLSLVASLIPRAVAQVDGSGKPNYIAIWSNSKKLTDSSIFETSSGKVGINTTAPSSTLDVNGSVAAISFSGSGSGLSNLQGANVQGAVATANSASTANNALALGGLPPTAYALAGSLPSIVASVALTNQTTDIPPTILLTPTQNTLYRISGYMDCAQVGSNTESFFIYWTDTSGSQKQLGNLLPQYIPYCNPTPPLNGSTWNLTIIVAAGSPLSYETSGSAAGYDIFFTVEQLQGGGANTRKAKVK
jgi:hypothetical protein